MAEKLDDGLLELWEDYRDERIRNRVINCASALSNRDFTVVPVPTASEANRVILSQVPLHKTVLYWDDAVLEELGIVTTLKARGNNTRNAMQLATGRGFRRPRVPQKSVYLSTVCAITMDGVLIRIAPELIPVWGPGRAPDSLILVAGVNHIVEGLEDGFRRVKDECTPQCAMRMGLDLECSRTERCVECVSPPAMCAVNTVVTRQPDSPAIMVVLIGERL
ncbi:MAG: LUD domain-containing protein [Candidatus Geothermincolia bacterium]